MKAKYSTFWNSISLLSNTKPSKAFLQLKGDPEIFSQLTQLHTMHGFNTYYYFHFNITNRDWDCKCGDATPPPPTQQWSENTSSISAPYIPMNAESSSLPSQDFMNP